MKAYCIDYGRKCGKDGWGGHPKGESCHLVIDAEEVNIIIKEIKLRIWKEDEYVLRSHIVDMIDEEFSDIKEKLPTTNKGTDCKGQ